MPVRDLLWACPVCRAPGAIRPRGRREVCRSCGTRFRRGTRARIVAEGLNGRDERTARQWLDSLGPVIVPEPGPGGVILGPETVRVKASRKQEALRFGGQFLGWFELYEPSRTGTMSLRSDGLHFRPANGATVHWHLRDLKGLQPASSSIQLAFRDHMASLKFMEGSVRLWSHALADVLRQYYARCGRDIVELQPCIRTCIRPETEP